MCQALPGFLKGVAVSLGSLAMDVGDPPVSEDFVLLQLGERYLII